MNLEAPEEVYDPRPLYVRLKEQADKKQAEFEESKKLKHLIKGLDNDEIAFLEMIDNEKLERETQKWKEEMQELEDYKSKVAHLTTEEQEKRLDEFKKTLTFRKKSNSIENKNTKKTQSALIANAIKRKPRTSESSDDSNNKKLKTEMENNVNDNNESSSSTNSETKNVTATCVGVLPGLGNYYSDSSDSDTSNSENEKSEEIVDFNLIVRKRVAKETKCNTHNLE